MRTRHYWFPFVQATVRQYPNGLKKENTRWGRTAYDAVKSALDDTSARPDGIERVRLVEMVHIKRTHTIDGAAMELHVSHSTASRWSRQFIYLVAEKLNFIAKQ